MLMSIEMSIIPYISTKCRWRRQWFTLFARRDEKKKWSLGTFGPSIKPSAWEMELLQQSGPF